MTRILSWLKKDDEEGATAVEYAIVLVLIAAVIIISVSLVGDKTRNAFDKASDALPGESTDDKCKDSPDDDDCGIGND